MIFNVLSMGYIFFVTLARRLLCIKASGRNYYIREGNRKNRVQGNAYNNP